MAKVTTIGAWRASIPRRVSSVKKTAVLHMWRGVTKRNPVLSGRSRAAWNVATDSPNLAVPEKPPRGLVLPRPPVPVVGEIPTGSPAILSNNLPYVPRLEDGSSTKAPQGMARLAFQATVQALGAIVTSIRIQFER